MILRFNQGKELTAFHLIRSTTNRFETNLPSPQPPPDRIFKAIERSTADKEDIGGIYLDELLVRVLPPSLGRNITNRTFKYLQERLLYTFPGDITGNGDIVSTASYLIDLVNINNTYLGILNLVISRLKQP